jgi:poly-gamma-glutamate capsule biosynthesis protein CapA/YwtB (metallophosphatase superfamily)
MPSDGLTIAVTGQALLHRAIDWKDNRSQAIRSALSSADAALVNLEAAVNTSNAWPTKTKTLHTTHPSALVSLRRFGFDVLGLANNHAFDLGPPGIAKTITSAGRVGLLTTGAGVDANEAERPAIVNSDRRRVAVIALDLGPQPDIVYASQTRAGINGLRVRPVLGLPDAEHETLLDILEQTGQIERDRLRIAVGYQASSSSEENSFFGTPIRKGDSVSRTLVPDTGDMERLRKLLTSLSGQAGFVVVMVHSHHWDPDWSSTPQWFEMLARALIDLGADMVAGTGAPVLQPMRFYKNRPIFSSLGNFVFHTARSETYDRLRLPVWDGAVASCHFAAKGSVKIGILPLVAGGPASSAPGPTLGPQIAEPRDAQRIFDHLTRDLSLSERALVTLANSNP